MKTYVIHKIKTALNIGGLKITPNVLHIGDRFVKRWNCAVGQTAANVQNVMRSLFFVRWDLRILIRNENEKQKFKP